MKNGNRNYWILGIVGCALFGIGDWLPGYADPAAVAEDFRSSRRDTARIMTLSK